MISAAINPIIPLIPIIAANHGHGASSAGDGSIPWWIGAPVALLLLASTGLLVAMAVALWRDSL